MSIRYDSDLDVIAKVNRANGEITVNDKLFNALPEFYRRFIIEHENGHYKLQTSNEFEADKYAFDALVGKSRGSLKNSVSVLNDVLSFNKPEDIKRLKLMLLNALYYDYMVYHNEAALEAIKKIKNLEIMNNTYEYFDASGLLTAVGGVVGDNSASADGGTKSDSGNGDFDWNQAIKLGGSILDGVQTTKGNQTTSTSKIDAIITPKINLGGGGSDKKPLDTTVNWNASVSGGNPEAAKTDYTMYWVFGGLFLLIIVAALIYFSLRKKG